MERALRCPWFQPSGVPQNRGLSCAFILCLPLPSGSGIQELDRCTLPGCGAPSPLLGPSLSFHPCQLGACAFSPPHPQPQTPPAPLGACALCLAATLRWMSTIQNLRRSLVRNWRPVCSAVGDAVLGAEPAPFPSALPPASGGAGPQPVSSSLDLLRPFVL